MSLRNRLEDASRAAALIPPARIGPVGGGNRAYQEIKSRIHHRLLERVDLAVMERLPAPQVAIEIKHLVEDLLGNEVAVLNQNEREQVVRDIQNEVQGLGPLEALLADPTVSDILVNTSKQVYVERRGRLEVADVHFEDDAHVSRIIDKIVSAIGRRVDESSPMVDARLQDGSRVNAIIPPLAIDGPILSIRRFGVIPLRMDDLIGKKSLTKPMAEILCGLVKARVNMLISGGTGTGKTTLLNVLSASIPATERIITIEDAAELQLQQPHVVRLETRPPNIEGKGEITQRSLVRNSLRMRPDRIIVGEVRGGEVVDMLQAMNTGHDGSMTTVHANGTRDALLRLENMVGMAGLSMTAAAIRHQITSALTVLVQVSRLSDGTRRVTSIEEITGMENDIITTQQIFTFTQTGIGPDDAVQGYFSATGICPKFAERLHVRGIRFDDSSFDPERIYQ